MLVQRERSYFVGLHADIACPFAKLGAIRVDQQGKMREVRRIPAERSINLVVLRGRGQPFLSECETSSTMLANRARPSGRRELSAYLATEDMCNPHSRIIDHVGEMIRRVTISLHQDEIIKILVPVGKATGTSETFGLGHQARGIPRCKESRGW